MKLLSASAAVLCAVALSACSMMVGGEGPPPDSPAARAPAALPPPASTAAPPMQSGAPASPAVPPEPEDLTPIPADQVRCIPPYVLTTLEKDGVTEARCVAPAESKGPPR